MALKIKWITLPSNYTCKNYFTDVKYDAKNNWVCRAIELAADDGILSRANAKARPQENITRAEALAILMNAGSVANLSPGEKQNYINEGLTFFYATGWQEEVLLKAYHQWIVITTPERGQSSTWTRPYWFFYNTNIDATRAEVFGFARNIILANVWNGKCYTGEAIVSWQCSKENGVWGEIIKYGEIVDTFTYWDNPYHGYECMIQYFSGNIRHSLLNLNGIPGYKIMNQIDAIELLFMEAGWAHIILWNNWFYYVNTFTDIQNCFNLISVSNFRKPNHLDVLALYYHNIPAGAWAYQMRSPAGVSLETFQSWYKNVTEINFREDTIKNLGDNTYEFLIDMTENDIISTYKVKSKVNVENFKINNISSVKQ